MQGALGQMRYYRDLPLQRKISTIVAVGMAAVTLLTLLYFFIFDIGNLKRDLGEEIRVLARITAARSAAAVAFGDGINAAENLRTLNCAVPFNTPAFTIKASNCLPATAAPTAPLNPAMPTPNRIWPLTAAA